MMTSQALNISITIPCASEFVGVVRLALSGVAARMNFSLDDIEDIKVAISEACTNAVQHAYGSNADPYSQSIQVDVLAYADRLEVLVKDKGKGFDSAFLGTEEQISQSEENLGLGLGLTFVKSLMDDVELTTSETGTILRMVKKTPSPFELVGSA